MSRFDIPVIGQLAWVQVFARLLPFGVTVVTFALVYKLLPNAKTSWRNVVPAAVLVGVVFYGLLFDDWRSWRHRRGDHWVLTDRRLLFWSRIDLDPVASIGLDQIIALPRPWLDLVLRLEDGQRVRLELLANPHQLRKEIQPERIYVLKCQPQNL